MLLSACAIDPLELIMTVRNTAQLDGRNRSGESSATSKAVIATSAGLGLLIAAFAVIDKLGTWASDYGTIVVYLAFFLWISIAGRVFWWGADTLVATVRRKSDASGDHR